MTYASALTSPHQRRRRPWQERLWSKVNKTDSCWLWTGNLYINGYGMFLLDYKHRRAHRVTYELLVGPIPSGLELDHLCRVRACVNPAHLEPVTTRVNQLRGMGPQAIHARQTHCIHGHEFTAENTRLYGHKGRQRQCRICKRDRDRIYRNRKVA